MQAKNEIMLAEVGAMLAEGMEVTIKAVGWSMSPYIRHRRDSLVLRAVPPESLACGDIVLARLAGGAYVAHRIVRADGENLTLKGDGNLFGTEKCRRADVLGRMAYLERNGRRIDCNTPGQRLKAKLGSLTRRTYLFGRAAAGKVLRMAHLK